jgi:hypothetical protein
MIVAYIILAIGTLLLFLLFAYCGYIKEGLKVVGCILFTYLVLSMLWEFWISFYPQPYQIPHSANCQCIIHR